jgi:CubicO group peptidase (beta-lactamase class C family)
MLNFKITTVLIFIIQFCHTQIWDISKNQQQLIDSLINDFPVNTEISFAIIKNGKTNFYGLQKGVSTNYHPLENHHSIYEIGSISKVFTSTLLCHFHVQNKVNVNDPISKYIKLKNQPKILFKQLANHTSGLPRLPTNIFNSMVENPKNPYLNYKESDFINYLKKDLKLINEIGIKYEYSNLGAGLLAYILAKINHSTYEDLLQEIIFRPLIMSNSTSLRKNVTQQAVKGLDINGNELTYWDFNILAGAGAILSSVSDLSKFIIANFDTLNPVYNIQQVETHDINENLSIALGWHIIKNKEAKYYWHNGATGGFMSSVTMDVLNKNAVIILSNVCPLHKKSKNIDELSFELLKTLYDTN